MRFEEAVAQLDERQPEHMPGPSLDRIRAVVEYLDHPELTYPTIHVTGTNGKTTAARVAAAVACSHGVTTGLFISPHLRSVLERLSVCGRDISEREFADEWGHLAPFLELVDAAGPLSVTYFEAVTALAFLWFADKPVGLAVFEVGMGGSWDATNVISGDVAVLCPIGMDHVAELGPTLADIAREKSGIIKPGMVAVVREQDTDAEQVVRDRATDVDATLRWEGPDWEVEERLRAVGGQSFRLRGFHATYEDLFLPLFGEHAVRNAAAGIVAVEAALGRALDEGALREGLAEVRAPGRLEIVARQPLIVLDGAHNPAGAEALATAMREFFTWDRLHLVLAVSANKDLAGIVRPLAPIADAAYAARNDSVRTADTAPIADAFSSKDTPVEVFDSVAAALDAARTSAAGDDVILVTGSLYTVADARRALGVP